MVLPRACQKVRRGTCSAQQGDSGGKDDLARGCGSDSTGIEKTLASIEAALDAP